ncbi:hypothetical protein HMI01_28190 [Halolactibacillus miurensis]|uniref:Uncharacterized protein n=1 Tax=Halolactibacillus miurensis TaxID=306541 RepID=A0A1I6V1D5_9BACI|nr:hypothetical protein HMI01_28190 [Halolactibacillus miurensis]SFT07529.1 hypothetical protein SAMN05421668_1409 [Halolactibacillus miurensis]
MCLDGGVGLYVNLSNKVRNMVGIVGYSMKKELGKVNLGIFILGISWLKAVTI